MAAYFAQDCPLCGHRAKYCLVDDKNRKYFDCPRCRRFQLGVRAEEGVLAMDPAWRERCAQQARQAPAGTMLVILSGAPSMGGTPPRLDVSLVQESELPLVCW